MNTTTTKGFTLSPRGSSLPSRKGFTLIELLVVVAIIGILAGIIITSLSNAREKARDARRDADIKTIQTALEIYYLDHGKYPSGTGLGGPGFTSLSNNNAANSAFPSWEGLEAEMGVTLPRDPVNETGGGPAHANRYLNYGYNAGVSIGCPAGQYYLLAYRHESGDAVGDERIGVTRCDNGNKWYAQYGAIVVGVTPAS